ENQVIVVNLGPVAIGAVDEDDLLVFVDADDLAHDDGGIALRAQDLANRCGDLCRRQRANGDLVEQRLEHVMVGAIDPHGLNGRLLQGLGGGQAGESSADDDDNGSSFTHDFSSSKSAASFGGRRYVSRCVNRASEPVVMRVYGQRVSQCDQVMAGTT